MGQLGVLVPSTKSKSRMALFDYFRRPGFESLKSQILAPKVDDEKLNDCLKRIRSQLPVPVIWLMGKTQSGKTSLIRALTGNSRAEIGNGFVPCTRTSSLYAYPTEEDCLIRFLDTRGLGEVSYDPSEDMAWCEGQAHLLVVVVKAMDHAQEPIVRAVEAVKKRHPLWPVIVLQTSLHEGYPRRDSQHVMPYPFPADTTTPIPASVPEDLARSLARQRQLFQGPLYRSSPAQFVPVDFTLPEDGFEPVDYGLEACWRAIEQALPQGFRGMIEQFREGRQDLRDMHLRLAHPHIISYALAAGAAAAVPVPLVDVPLVIALQAKMVHTIASIYNQELTKQRLAEIASGMGVGFAGRLGLRELAKFIPWVGSALAAGYSAASTYALGRTLCSYFSHVLAGDVPSQERFRELFDEEFKQARGRLGEYLKQYGKPPASGTPAAPPPKDSRPYNDVAPGSAS